MTLRTPKPTREERAAMTHDELLRSIWLLDEVIELFRWIPADERLPDKDMAIYATIEDHWGRREVIEADYINGDFVRDKKYSLSLIIKAWQPRYIPTPFIPKN